MIEMISALHIDFNNYNGHQMTLSGKEPIHKSQLDELELHMHTENHIPCFLPMSWIELDGRVSFHYKIEGYRLLAHHLRAQKMSMQRYYSLLLSIADGLSTCYDYMLRPQCCLIDEQLLYIDEAKDIIAIAYLPLKQPLSLMQEQSLLLLAVRWADMVTDLDAKGYHRLLQLLSVDNMQIQTLRQLLLDLIHERLQGASRSDSKLANKQQHFLGAKQEGENLSKGVHLNNIQREPSIVGSTVEKDEQQESVDRRQHDKKRIMEETPAPVFQYEAELAEGNDLDDEYVDEELRLNWKHAAVSVLIVTGIILCWIKLYAPSKSFELMLLCIGITVVLLSLLALLIYKPVAALFERSKNEDEGFELLTEHAVQASSRLAAAIHQPAMQQDNQSARDSGYESSPLQHKQNNNWGQLRSTNYGKHEEGLTKRPLQLATVKLEEQGATQLLNEQPMLIRRLNGEQETIMLLESFLIGRAEDGVHYQEEAAGVSRIHLELGCEKGDVIVKDVGSRNGTYLNGQLMIAYKAYPLQAGDQLQLASLEGPIYERVS